MKIDIFADNLKAKDCRDNPILFSACLIATNHSSVMVVRENNHEMWRFPSLDIHEESAGFDPIATLRNTWQIPDTASLEKTVVVTLYLPQKTMIRTYYRSITAGLDRQDCYHESDHDISWVDSVALLSLFDGSTADLEDSELLEADFIALVNSI
jgi:hypothetical protein